MSKVVTGNRPSTTTYVYDAADELAAEYSTAAGDSGTAYLTADYAGRTRLVADANLNPLHFSAA